MRKPQSLSAPALPPAAPAGGASPTTFIRTCPFVSAVWMLLKISLVRFDSILSSLIRYSSAAIFLSVFAGSWYWSGPSEYPHPSASSVSPSFTLPRPYSFLFASYSDW